MSAATRLNPFTVNERYAGIYAHGVEAPETTRTVYVSGQVGVSPEGHLPADFAGQCHQAISNVEAVLNEAGMGLSNIIKMSFYLVRREDMGGLVEVRKAMLDGVQPAITTVFVAGLVEPEWLVEVEAIASAAKRKPVQKLVRHLGNI